MNPDSSSVLDVRGALDAPPPLEQQRRLVNETKQQWEKDGGADAEAFLKKHPDLGLYKSLVVDLAYEEFCQRTDAGEVLDWTEFSSKFKFTGFDRSVERAIDVHQYIDRQAGRWPEIGEQFLGFHLEEELGCGSFARVFLARDPSLGERFVAVKVTHAGELEAAHLGRLEHPSIVPVHSVRKDPDTGLTAICMPFFGRATLFDVIAAKAAAPAYFKQGSQILQVIARMNTADHLVETDPPHQLLNRGRYVDAVALLGAELADGLARAHKEGVLHLDVKPSNVLLKPNGRPMLLDFNLACEEQNLSSRVGGTLLYMSPEQLTRFAVPDEPTVVDQRADVYSLGVMLYEAITGRVPFSPDPTLDARLPIIVDLLKRQRNGSPAIRNEEIDSRFERLLRKCLSVDPAHRPQTAAELAQVLRQQIAWPGRLRRWCGRHKKVVIAATVLVGVGGPLEIHHLLTRPSPAMREFEQGQKLYRAQEYTGAIDAITHALKLDPDIPAARFALNMANFDRGQELYREGKYPEAIEAFTQVLEATPDDPEVRFARSRAYIKLNQCDDANGDLDVVLKFYSDGKYQAAKAYAASHGKIRSDLTNFIAVRHYKLAIETGYSNARVFNNLGCVILPYGIKNFDLDPVLLTEAYQYFTQAIDADGSMQVAYINRARVGMDLAIGKNPRVAIDEVIADYETAIKIGPKFPQLFFKAAKACNEAEDKQAGKGIDRALRIVKDAIEFGISAEDFTYKNFGMTIELNPDFQELVKKAKKNKSKNISAKAPPPMLDPIDD